MAAVTEKLEFHVLGPLRIVRGGTEVELNAPMQRKLLLRLLLDVNHMVSRDQLQESLWPWAEDDKSSALRFHIAKLRDAIDPGRADVIATEGSGYRLSAQPDQVDSERFMRDLGKGQSMIDDDPARALRVLESALGMWVGSPYADAEFEDFARPEIRRLEEGRMRAHEGRIEAMLRLGLHEEILADLEKLVREHPLRERLRGQQMLALYRSGRSAEALRAYSDAKRTLGEEMGIEPSAELADLEEKILFGEEDLLQTPAPSGATVNNVPAPSLQLIGRVSVLEEVERLLDSARIVTLIGVGGVGKTRLAQAVGLREDHGFESVSWVALSEASRREEVLQITADAVGIVERQGVEIEDAVMRTLSDRHTLLIFDNCEHLIPQVTELVRNINNACPGVTVVATSRRPLGLKGEAVFRVPHLSIPAADDKPHQIGQAEAVAFLVTVAAQKGRPVDRDDLDAVGSIVRRLEGNPLAIELAVARLSALSVRDLDRRLAESLTALGSAAGDELDHRRSMRATMEWSLGLLSAEARALFERMKVFAGGADLLAIEAVAGFGPLDYEETDRALEELIDASLVDAWDHGTGRRMAIPATVAGIATAVDLTEEDMDNLALAHARHYALLADDGHGGLIAEDQEQVLARFEVEEANLKKALTWSEQSRPDLAVSLARGLGRFWYRVGKHREARDVLSGIAARPGVEPSRHLNDVLATLSYLALLNGDLQGSRRYGERLEETAEETGAFTAQIQARFTESTRLWATGDTAESVGRLSDALDDLGPRSDPLAVYMLRALGRRHVQLGYWDWATRVVADLRWWSQNGHPAATAALDEMNGAVAFYLGNVHQAELDLASAIERTRLLGARHELAEVLNLASNNALAQGDLDKSTTLAIEALGLARETQARGVESQSLALLGNALARATRDESAWRNLMEAVDVAREAPARVELVWAVSFLAAFQASRGAAESAVALYSAADRAGAEMGLYVPENLNVYREKQLRTLGDHLGQVRFEKASARGIEASLDEGVSALILS
jgi:predicted ATPase/DNA-binding SARP family transcriptional activator